MAKVLRMLCTVALAAWLAPAATAAPIAKWPLDEGSGQIASDASGHGHNGQLGALPGADAFDPVWTAGRLGSALRFVGAERQYVTVSASAALVPSSVSVEAWVRRSGTPGQYRYLFASGARECESAPYGLYSGISGGLAFYVSDATSYVVSPPATQAAVWDGGWHYVAGTYDGQAVRLYVDGTQVGAGTATGLVISSAFTATGVSIGSYRGTCELPFTGDVDEVAVHGQALGAQEIADIHASVSGRPEPNQSAPVTGPPVDPRTLARSCLKIKVTPRRIVAGKRTVVRVTVRRLKRLAAGVRVVVRGPALAKRVRTGPAGKARMAIRPRRRGRLSVKAASQPRRCGRSIIRVARRR